MAMTAAALKKKIKALKVGERFSVKNLDEDIYHAVEDAIGSSLLKAAAHSLAHYKAAVDHVDEDERGAVAQENLNIGSATHCAVLQPEIFDDNFVAMPESIKRRSGEEWKLFSEENKDKTILLRKSMDLVNDMANSALDGVGHYFIDGDAEISYFYRHETGLILKARLDYERGDAIIDLKTTIDGNPEKFSRTVKYDYDWQDALYRLVADKKEMMFVGIEKKTPHSVYLAKQGGDVRIRSERRLNEVLTKLAFAQEYQEFPSYPVELVETGLTNGERDREPTPKLEAVN